MARQPIDEMLADPDTPSPLREQLLSVQRARAHATHLGLEVGDHYTSYVAWEGDRLLTAVVATEPGSVDVAPFSYPVLGELPYKGFFDGEAAEREAERLRGNGLDVCVSAVTAYSTLGWLNDPLTAPMLQRGEGPLVETIVHELVHTNVFVDDDPEFNESVATFVGEEASLRYFDDVGKRDREAARIRRKREVSQMLLGFREEVSELYAAPLPEAEKTHRRRSLEARQRERLAKLDPSQSVRLNDACLALHGTYAKDLAAHARVLDFVDGDLGQFIARLRRAAESDNARQTFGVPTGAGG